MDQTDATEKKQKLVGSTHPERAFVCLAGAVVDSFSPEGQLVYGASTSVRTSHYTAPCPKTESCSYYIFLDDVQNVTMTQMFLL